MQSTSGTYFSRLDHLRFLAAFLVLAWHASHMYGLPTSYVPDLWVLSIFEEGHTGVSLFMTLSGFIFLALTRDSQISYWGFLRNRVIRIAPLFLLWVYFWYVTSPLDPVQTIIAVATTLNFPNRLGLGWTIVVEFQFYLLFPFLLVFVQRYGPKYLVGLVLLMIGIRLGSYLTIGPVQPMGYWTILGRLDQFLMGMLGFEIYRRQLRILKSPIVLLAVLVVWVVASHGFNLIGGLEGTMSSPIWVIWPTVEGAIYALLTASYLMCPIRLPQTLDRGLAWLGMLSFSLYLNHMMAIALASNVLVRLGISGEDWGLEMMLAYVLLICLPMTVVMSVATFYLVEKPFLSLRKTYQFSHRDAQVPESARASPPG